MGQCVLIPDVDSLLPRKAMLGYTHYYPRRLLEYKHKQGRLWWNYDNNIFNLTPPQPRYFETILPVGSSVPEFQ
jgi:hypothetical protein